MSEILRRKLRHAQEPEPSPHALVDQAWRLAIARALREGAGLSSETTSLTSRQCGLDDLPEIPPERALIALLDGPGGAMGIAALSPELTTSLIEMQTIGRVGTAPPGDRRPTRTDAAMISPMLDRALSRFDFLITELPDARVEEGFRFASLLDDARSIGLLLDDQPYHLMIAKLTLAGGAREGEIMLALPLSLAAPQQKPTARGVSVEQTARPDDGLGEARCELRAVLGQRRMTLNDVMQLEPGQVLALHEATLAKISLRGIDGKTIAMARLGQQNGHRALRITICTGGAANPEAGGDAAPMTALPSGQFAPESMGAPMGAMEPSLASSGYEATEEMGANPAEFALRVSA